MNFLKKAESGFAQLVVLGVMALMAVALPLTTNLVKKNQENRSKAAEDASIAGICGSVNGISRYFFQISDEWLCSKGVPIDLKGVVDLQPGQTSPVTWSCLGLENSLKANCAATQIYADNVAGVCGSANGTVKNSKPKTSLCIAGIASEVVTKVDRGKNYYSWRCGGVHGGSSVDCGTIVDQNVDSTSLSATKVDMYYGFREDNDYRMLDVGMTIVNTIRLNTYGKGISSAKIVYYHTDKLSPFLNGVTGDQLASVVSHKDLKNGFNELVVNFDKNKKLTGGMAYEIKIATEVVKLGEGTLSFNTSDSLVRGLNNEVVPFTNMVYGTQFVMSGSSTSLTPTISPVVLKPYLFLKTDKDTYSVGETFTVTVGVDSIKNKIGGVDGVLNYKGSASLISVKKSPDFVFKNSDDDCVIGKNFTNGKVTFTCFVGDSVNDKAVNGNLVDLTFVAKENGISTIAFECNPGETANDSNVVVNSADVIDCSKNVNLHVRINGTSPNPNGRFIEGKHINLDLIKDYKSVISDDKLKLWVSRLDKEYEVLSELTSRAPFDGRKITIKEYKCDENGSDQEKFACGAWAGAGETTIWSSGGVESELKKVNDSDDWSFGVLHEISHSFDTSIWNFDGELMANLKMVYFLEKSGGKVWQNNRFYTGKEIKDFYKNSSTWGYDDVLKSGNYASDFMAYKLLDIKDKIGGWETYKKTFKNLLNSSYIPELTDLDRLNIFLNELTNVSGKGVRSLFSDREREIIKSKFGGGFDTESTLIINTTPTLTPNVISGKPYSRTTASCKAKDGVCATYSKSLSTGAKCKVNKYDAVGKVKTGLCPGNTKTVCCTGIRDSRITPTLVPTLIPVGTSVIDGKCGSTRNSCIAGMVNDGDLPDTSSDYKWRCIGANGGNNVSCSLKKRIDGKCGSKKNTCISGSVSVMTGASNLYKWRCVGRYDGKTVTCSIRK